MTREQSMAIAEQGDTVWTPPRQYVPVVRVVELRPAEPWIGAHRRHADPQRGMVAGLAGLISLGLVLLVLLVLVVAR